MVDLHAWGRIAYNIMVQGVVIHSAVTPEAASGIALPEVPLDSRHRTDEIGMKIVIDERALAVTKGEFFHCASKLEVVVVQLPLGCEVYLARLPLR